MEKEPLRLEPVQNNVLAYAKYDYSPIFDVLKIQTLTHLMHGHGLQWEKIPGSTSVSI